MKNYHFDHIDLFNSFCSTRGLIRMGDHDAAIAYLNLLTTVLAVPAFVMVERWNEFVRSFDV